MVFACQMSAGEMLATFLCLFWVSYALGNNQVVQDSPSNCTFENKYNATHRGPDWCDWSPSPGSGWKLEIYPGQSYNHSALLNGSYNCAHLKSKPHAQSSEQGQDLCMSFRYRFDRNNTIDLSVQILATNQNYLLWAMSTSIPPNMNLGTVYINSSFNNYSIVFLAKRRENVTQSNDTVRIDDILFPPKNVCRVFPKDAAPATNSSSPSPFCSETTTSTTPREKVSEFQSNTSPDQFSTTHKTTPSSPSTTSGKSMSIIVGSIVAAIAIIVVCVTVILLCRRKNLAVNSKEKREELLSNQKISLTSHDSESRLQSGQGSILGVEHQATTVRESAVNGSLVDNWSSVPGLHCVAATDHTDVDGAPDDVSNEQNKNYTKTTSARSRQAASEIQLMGGACNAGEQDGSTIYQCVEDGSNVYNEPIENCTNVSPEKPRTTATEDLSAGDVYNVLNVIKQKKPVRADVGEDGCDDVAAIYSHLRADEGIYNEVNHHVKHNVFDEVYSHIKGKDSTK